MVSVPSPVQNYLLLWVLSLGSAVFLMFIAAMVYLTTGDSSVTQLFILMYNATASAFILLTMIPVGVFILVFGTIANVAMPIIAPAGAAVFNFFAGTVVRFFGQPYTDLVFVTQVTFTSPKGAVQIPQLNVVDTITAVTNFLAALRDFLIGAATGGGIVQ